MNKQPKLNLKRLQKETKPVKIVQLSVVKESPSFLALMEKYRKIIAESGIPKIPGR